MNYIFSGVIILSIFVSFITGTAEETIEAGILASKNSIELVLSFAGIMCMWSGFLKVSEAGGASRYLSKLLSPVINFLFPKLKNEKTAKEYISANIGANILGVGNAATPAGIKAMEELDKINKSPVTVNAITGDIYMNTFTSDYRQKLDIVNKKLNNIRGVFMKHANWNGFKEGVWMDEINVRDFIQQNYKEYKGDDSFLAGKTAKTAKDGDIVDAFNGKVNETGISPTITTRPEGFKTAILPVQSFRIRKLTPKECWRLMGFDDTDFEKAKKVNSNTQLYKQAGNSIVVDVLEAILKELLC